MKKLMRIALVFALAGATLVGCTKDYSGDITDLNNQLGRQEAAITTLQAQVVAAQTTANEALEAAKKADDSAAIAALEAKIKELAAVDEELKDAIAKGDKANADAIAALETKVNDLLAQVKELADAFVSFTSITAPASQVKVTFDYAKFVAGSSDTYKALVAAFPEVKAFDGFEITQGGHVPFSVNPESFEFDDTFAYSFVGVDGKAFPATLSNPVKGLVGAKAGATNGSIVTKAAASGYWTLSFAPTVDAKKKTLNATTASNLSLVVTKDEDKANTAFAYEVAGNLVTADVTIAPAANSTISVKYAEPIDLFTAGEKGAPVITFENELDGKFIISAAAGADNALLIEKYGVKFGAAGESTVSVTKYPENINYIEFGINVKALGLNGSAAEKNYTLRVEKAYAADGVLAEKTITYNTDKKGGKYSVRWSLADYNFTKEQTKAFVEAEQHWIAFFVYNEKGEAVKFNQQEVTFYDKDGKTTTAWDQATSFGYDYAEEKTYSPYEYDVVFYVGNADKSWPWSWDPINGLTWPGHASGNTVYAAESTITTQNAADLAKVYLLKELCDENGVLQAVGTSDGTTITYTIDQAIVLEPNDEDVVAILDYYDPSFNPKAKETVSNYNWIREDGDHKLQIPANGQKDSDKNKFDYVNNVEHTLVAEIIFFNDPYNTAEFEFDVKVVSPIYEGDETPAYTQVTNRTVYFNPGKGQKNSYKVSEILTTHKLVAGKTHGNYDPFNYRNGQVKSLTVAFDNPSIAEKVLETFGDNYKLENPTGNEVIKARQDYSIAELGSEVVVSGKITINDKWGMTMVRPFTVTCVLN